MKYKSNDEVLSINVERMPMIGCIKGSSSLGDDTYIISVCMGEDGMVDYSIHEGEVVCKTARKRNE